MIRRNHAGTRKNCAGRLRGAISVFALALSLCIAARGQLLDKAVQEREAGNVAAAQAQQQIDRLSDETEDLEREFREATAQAQALEAYNAQVEKLIEAQEKEAESLQAQIDRVALVGRQMTPLMLEMLDTLEQFVERDVPFLLEERHTRIRQLRDLMNRADVSNAEKYRRLLEAYQIENEYGRTIEAYRGRLDRDGSSKTVDFLRIGRLVLAYQTLDGTEIGVWNPRTGAWEELPERYRLEIRRGLRIARKQAAPDLIILPVPPASGEDR